MKDVLSPEVLAYLQSDHVADQLKRNFVAAFEKIKTMSKFELVKERRHRMKEFHKMIQSNKLYMKDLTLF